MFAVRNFWGAVGVIFSLIALFLVLDRAAGATSILEVAGRTGRELVRTLQGR